MEIAELGSINLQEMVERELDTEALDTISNLLGTVQRSIQTVVVGMDEAIEAMIIALLSNGHVLLEGVPGVAKTLSVRALSRVLDMNYKRIQFTPDLLPSDVTGVSIYKPNTGDFIYQRGPIFTNILLADEINRAPPKTQAAMLEAMQERQVSVENTTHKLDEPFFVLATQNPVEQEGTFPLPEAQVDRFMMKLEVGYPTLEDELEIVSRYNTTIGSYDKIQDITPILSGQDLLTIQKIALDKVHVTKEIIQYVVSLVNTTRSSEEVLLGASPRGSLWLTIASKARALIKGRQFVTPLDVQAVVGSVLSHRVIIKPEYAYDGTSSRQVLDRIVRHVPVPSVE